MEPRFGIIILALIVLGIVAYLVHLHEEKRRKLLKAWAVSRGLHFRSAKDNRFHDVFPTNISTIDLNYDTTDTIQEFTVEMQVQWWEAIKGIGPNAGGQDIF